MRPSMSAFVSGAGAQPDSSERLVKRDNEQGFHGASSLHKHHRQRPYFRSRPRVEGVAFAQIARIESHFEPAHSLLRGAMGEGFRDDVTLRALLDLVVADGGCGAQPFLEIARLEQVALLCEKSPYAGIAVRL